MTRGQASSATPDAIIRSSAHDDKPSRGSRDRSVDFTSSGGREHIRAHAIAIPTSDSRNSGQLHLDLPHPSISFRDHLMTESTSEGSSRFQRIASGMRRFTPSPARAGPPDTPWSLFGELMETEGQLPVHNLSTPKIKQRKARTNGESAQTSYASLRESESDPFLITLDQPVTSIASPQIDIAKQQDRVSSPEPLSADYTSDTSETTIHFAPASTPRWSLRNWLSDVPILYQNIFKCAIAYFFGSLFTFNPILSGLLSDITSYGPGERRPSPTGHMVATVAVYFNPAKTMGGMIEADTFCFLGLLYAAMICLCSMSMFWWLDVIPGWEWLAEASVILWIGVSMSAVAWMKVWMAKPSFNPACSMIAIILFVVVVKEGGAEMLLHVALTVLFGAIISNLVCYSIWPQSATINLHENVTKTLDSFSTLLHILTSTFLLETHPHKTSNESLQKAVENHQASFTTLKKNLQEAHSEWLFTRTKHRIKSASAYQDAVDSLNRLAQHLNGLRGGTRLQYELAKAQSDGKLVLKHRKLGEKRGQEDLESNGNIKGKIPEKEQTESQDAEEDQLLREAAAMFGELVDDLGPPLKALSNTCTVSLNRLRDCLARRRNNDLARMIEPDEFNQLADKIEQALFTFESTSNHAVMRLYRKSESSRVSVDSDAEDSAVAGNDNEHVFLVYFFIFTLQEFGRELVMLVAAMERIYEIEQQLETRRGWLNNILRGLVNLPAIFSCADSNEKVRRPGLRKSISAMIVPRINPHKHSHFFPKIRPHAPNTIQTPSWSDLSYVGRVKQTLWTIGAAFKERNLKFAIKAGMATGILAAPAFFEATRPIFTEYRGEWALISFFVVISPTIGATNFMGVHRVLGTFLGAGVAAGIYTLFPENPLVLSLFGFFCSLPCFYFIVAVPDYATSARFVLLAYNLTCLFCYNSREVDISVLDVAFHRSVSVTVGVVWAALVSRFWWPSEARRELSKALGEFCLNMGWLYTRLVASNSSSDARDYVADRDDSSSGGSELPSFTSKRVGNSVQQFMAMELHLQIKLIEIQGLLAQAQHEPRLKGPFPIALYRSILTSLQRILDRLHSMRCVTTREEWWTSVRQDFIMPVNKERREMVGNIILNFSTFASAFRLKAPLPPYLPPAEQSRQRLVDAIRRLEIVKNRDVKGSKQLLFFAYALTMKGVTRELDYLGRTLQDAFGVIGQNSEEFEALFKERRRDVEQNA